MSTSSGIKNSVLLVIEKCILLCLSFLNSVLLARIAGPEVFGQYTYILSMAGLFLPLSVMGLNNIVTKYIVKNPNNAHYYLKSAIIVRLCGALLSIALGILLVLFLNNKNNTSILLLILLILNILKCTAILNSAPLSILILLQGLEYVLIGLSYALIYILGKHHHFIKRSTNKLSYIALAQKGKWLLFSGIAATIYLKIDQIMLANLIDNQAVAYYAAAAKLSEVWYVFPVLIANVFTAQLSKLRFDHYQKYQKLLQQLVSVLTLCALMLSIATYFLAPALIELIYGQEYHPSAAILSIHIFASIFIFQRAILSKWLIIEKLYKYSLISSLSGAVVNIILNAILIPYYAGVGAAWATVFSYMVASYGFLFFQPKTKRYAQVLHQSMLNSPSIIKSLIHQRHANKK